MNDRLETNLALLEPYHPELASKLRAYTPQPSIEVVPTSSGENSLRVHTDGKAHLLHSSRDPVQEAKRWLTSHVLESNYHVLIYGCGLFHHAYQLVRDNQRTLRTLIVVEKRLDVLHATFCHVDLRPFLQRKSTHFLLDPADSEIRSFMNTHLTGFTMDGLSRLKHEPSVALDEAWYQNVDTIVSESLRSGEMLLRTRTQLGGLIQENIIRNLPALLTSPTISALQNLLSNIPAFVVGAGPSLDNNIDALSRIGDQGVIIAVDTVYRLLVEKSITPHLIVTTDPTPLNIRHFEGVSELGTTALVFSPSVQSEVLDQIQGTRISIPLPNSRFLSTLKDVLGQSDWMPPGINVGQTGFNLARYMGCSPITLVGMDFSFPKEGGATHVSGAALRRTIAVSESPGKMLVDLISDTPETEEFEPILIPGSLDEEVATNQFWFAYLRSMEEEIRKTPVRVINATEGGALIQGADILPLHQVIADVCNRDCMIESTLQMSVGFYFGSGATEGLDVVKQSIEILDTARTHCEEGLKSVAALEKVLSKSSTTPEVIQTLLREILTSHQAAIQEQKLYIVLDEAADRVLEPFLRREGRPEGDSPSMVNAQNTAERFRGYFQGMIEMCSHYGTLLRETRSRLEESNTDAGGFGF